MVVMKQDEFVDEREGPMTVTEIACSAGDHSTSVVRPSYREGYYAAQLVHAAHVEAVGGNDIWGVQAALKKLADR